MKKDKLVQFSEIIRDGNIDEYTKNEMCKSMISVTGVPKTFHRPTTSSVILMSDKDEWRPDPQHPFEGSMPLKSQRFGRSKSFLQKQENLVNHKQEKMIQKISVPCPKQYYEKLPIKPGFGFFDCLLRVPRGSVTDLKINIPEGIYYKEKIYYIYTSEDGSFSYRNDVFGYKFLRILEQHRLYDEENLSSRIAAIVRATSDDLNDMQKFVMDWGQINMKLSSNELIQYTLIQRFIHTPGHRPAVTRLHYFANNKDNKANYAYFINNITTGKKKTYEDLQKFVVNTKDPSNIEYFVKSGTAIKYYEQEAKKIVKFLNKGYNIRIEKIVLDFLTDSEGKIWLSGCKACEIDLCTVPNSLVPLQDWWESGFKQVEKKKEENQYLMNFVHCKLCRLYYTNNQLSHLVSVRMLMVFKVHSLGRGELPLDTSHLKVTSNDMLSQSVRICQYCYMLVTSEFELMNVEEALGKALNIPKKDLSYEEDPKIQVQKHFLPKKLTQYRILVFISKIYEAKFNKNLKNLHIHLKFEEIVTSFKIKLREKEENGERLFVVDLLKVHYVLVAEGKSLEKLINSEVLEIKLTNSEKYNEKSIALSKSQCLKGLPVKLKASEAYYTKKQILLFSPSDEVLCNLSVYVGLSCDKTLDYTRVKVPLNKVFDFYIPDFHYMSVDPLPISWLELFNEDIPQEESFANRIEESQFYRPVMSMTEMLRMEDITSPYKAIPKIYKEKKKEEPVKVSSPSMAIYNVVNDYFNVRQIKHKKKASWSAARKSGRTSATSNRTPFGTKLKKSDHDFIDEL